MSIGYRKQSAASVPTPVAGEMNTFIDSADDKLKRKDSTGVVTNLEGIAAGVSSFESRVGAVVSQPGDYAASEITNTPFGSIIATDVQAAINQLDSNKATVAHVGAGGPSEHPVVTGSVAGFMSPSDFTKLTSVASGATANDTDANLKNRANHTGTQTAGTITGLATVATTGLKSDVGLGNVDDTSDVNKPVSIAQASADTAVQSFSIQRSNHTGTQTSSTISDFNSAADLRITAQKGFSNGLATLDGAGKIPSAQLPIDSTEYLGVWSPASNTPTLVDGTGNRGDFYKVSTTATRDLGSGPQTFRAGEVVIYSGTVWDRVGTNDAVNSVNSYVGAVTLNKSDLSLGDVDNTSDLNKPISIAQAAVNATKLGKSGDVTTGPLGVKGTNTGDGFINYETQTANPATPSSGFNLYANALGKFSWKGTNGFFRTFDGTANTADRTYTLPDANVGLMGDPMTTAGDLVRRSAANITERLPVGNSSQLLRVMAGLPVWDDENLGQDFGDGNLGNVTISGALTLASPVYYDKLMIEPGCQITTNGYPIYCKTLDLTNATTANAIRWNGLAGTNAVTQTGGSGGAALASQMLGGSSAGTQGGSGVVGAGVQSGAPTNLSPANGGSGGSSGASGNGVNAGVAGRGGGSATNRVLFGRLETAFLRGSSLITAAAGGAGGSSGGGDGVTVSNSTGGGGGGSGAGTLAIYADEIITSASTASGLISAVGGNGANGRSSPTVGTGGASGGGGGGGGYIFIAYNKKTGPVVASLITVSGGNGGNGGNSVNGTGGAGGNGGNSGYVDMINFGNLVGVHVGGVVGSAGALPSGTVGGSGGPGGIMNVSL
jgi:hypothetical protein